MLRFEICKWVIIDATFLAGLRPCYPYLHFRVLSDTSILRILAQILHSSVTLLENLPIRFINLLDFTSSSRMLVVLLK